MEPAGDFLAQIIDNAGEGIVVYDRELRYLLWNRFMEEMTGMGAADVIGRCAVDLFPHIREQQVDDLLARALGGETVSSPDIHYIVPQTGRQGWISSVYRPHADPHGNVVGVIGLIRDISDRKAAQQQIEYQAYHDALTGLANRRLFQEHLSLALALAGRHERLVAVLFLDLDHFKLVNDSLGHTIGDALLREIARRLKETLHEGDTVARVGGDEFTIVIQELACRDAAAVIARKVMRAVAEPIDVDGHRLYITTSIGITIFPDDGDDAETLLKNADTAMYRAKAQGRNTYQMSTHELNRSTQERMTLESGLHRAVECGEFDVFFQPQIQLGTMAIIGMEALLRWNHPERGIVAPADFIGVAEDHGLIVIIGDWVIREACREARKYIDRGAPGFRVAVNISARQFRDPSLLTTIEAAIAEAGIEPSALEIEITETIAMEDADATIATLTQLRAIGVSIAIDDFGTGPTALSYLKRFPIDALKIDKGFVLDLPGSLEDAAIVQAVIQLAKGLGLRVIAEGVETAAQLAFRQKHGCTEVQGFYFSYPVPACELDAVFEGV
jgi:diguanylate cyclase (GGDEF)-like protein/PAS domain S-box-containing protein